MGAGGLTPPSFGALPTQAPVAWTRYRLRLTRIRSDMLRLSSCANSHSAGCLQPSADCPRTSVLRYTSCGCLSCSQPLALTVAIAPFYSLSLACARTIVLRLQPFGCLFTAQGSRTRPTVASRPQLLMLRSAPRPPRQPKIHCVRGSEALFTCHRRGEII